MDKNYYFVSPGEILQEFLEDHKLSQADLAKRTGLTVQTINYIVRGRDNVSSDTAVKFAAVFGTSMAFWLNLQSNFQVAREQVESDERALAEATKYKADLGFYNELVAAGYVEKAPQAKEKIKNLWKFFAVPSLDIVPAVQGVAFRRQKTKTNHGMAIAAWLRAGEKDALAVEVGEFNREKLATAVGELRKMTAVEGDIKVKELSDRLAGAGVKFVRTPALKGIGVNAATRWVSDRPLVQLTERGKSSDRIWFNLFHELGHIMKHGKKDAFIEFEDGAADGLDEKEKEANVFASDALIPRSDWRRFLNSRPGTEKEIIDFAKEQGISPGIVAGQLQHHFGNYRLHKSLQRPGRLV